MQDWGFQELRWRQSFFDWIGLHYTAEAWNDASQRAVPTKPVAAFERTLVKGEALAFPGDEQTMQVLQRAAKYHVERSDNWLRLQTLVFALIEQARCDPTVRSVLAPIWKAVEPIEEQYQAALHSYLDSRTSVDGEASFDALNISPRVLNGLEAARELAVMTSRDVTHVGVLQLAGALISRRVDNDEDLGRIGLDAQALRRALVDHAAARGQNADVWREALGEEEAAATGRPVDLNSDEPEAVVRMDADWKTDPLGIRPDVHSFAALLASRSLEPPLSIGLFGPWGSGKTTFLKRLRLVVDQRCADAKTALAAGMQSPWVRNVVHVEFNAWHFAEDALVSSLIDTIVREVRAFIKDDRPAIGMALLEMRAKTAESARRAVDDAKRRREEAREEVDVKAKELANHEAEARQSMVSLQNAMQTVWKATIETAMASQIVRESGLIDRIGGTVQSAEELQKRIDGIRARSAPMLAGLGWYRSVLFAGLVLGLPLVVAWLVQRLLNLDGFAQVLAWASTTLSAGALWLRAASGVAAKLDRAVGKISREYEEQLLSNKGLQEAKQAHAAADAKKVQAAEALAAAERSLQDAEAAALTASLPSQMLTLASARLDDGTYARDLTTISTARADLQALSHILRDQARGEASGQTSDELDTSGLRPIERVILYVDDLDRCRPEQVVRVLQLVHMLLAFELFVVVVAVDARWVEESLKKNYQWLAEAEAVINGAGHVNAPRDDNSNPVTPQDYLEKIFQISFWLEPMTAGRAAAYLKSLVRQRHEPDPSSPLGRAISGTGLESAGRIDVEPTELDYMRALAAYVGPSPRRVKRLVNAYRLLKARMSDAQLNGFITDRSTEDGEVRSGPYQIVIGLLVIGTGAPLSGARILKDLAERDPRDSFDQVIEAYRERKHPDWTMAARVLETLMRTQKARDLSELRGWARRVGRFLLQGPTDALR